jgi:beta-glucanase (GH16 family)
MKLPVGAGLWPAFWMLGVDISSVGWPACGEIDILENVPAVGENPLGPGVVRSTIHGPGYSGKNGIGKNFKFPGGARVDDGFHRYGVVWSETRIEFYVDDPAKPFLSVAPAVLPKGSAWVFKRPFHLMLNLAVGGDWPGPPDQSTPNPALMLVDYVRVYEAVRR